MAKEACPVCLSEHTGQRVLLQWNGSVCRVDCEVCGTFDVTASLVEGELSRDNTQLKSLHRAALSHLIRQTASDSQKPPRITTYTFHQFMENPALPTPARQAINVIRLIGDKVRSSGQVVANLQPSLYAKIGAASPKMAGNIVTQLAARNWIAANARQMPDGAMDFLNVDLTLDGWDQYEKERAGKVSTRVGFLALDFKESVLNKFVAEVLKPAVKEGIGHDLVDMRDVSRAGIIDNLMREQIRDAAFVIAELTNDNAGAYWEAGYAEGLGKPVIYICEKAKIAKTHFDTNHCTTVPWDDKDHEGFKKELIATLRRSLRQPAEP